MIDTVNDPGKSEASPAFDPQTDYGRWTTELLDDLGIEKAKPKVATDEKVAAVVAKAKEAIAATA